MIDWFIENVLNVFFTFQEKRALERKIAELEEELKVSDVFKTCPGDLKRIFFVQSKNGYPNVFRFFYIV